MMRPAQLALTLFLAAAACGDPEPSAPDAGADAMEADAMEADAAVDPDLWGRFTAIASLNGGAALQHDPALSVDELEVYFACSGCVNGLGRQDIFRSTRTAVTAAWSPPVLASALSSVVGDLSPRLTADGLTIYLSSDRPGGPGSMDVWTSTRADRTSDWTTPTIVTSLSSADADRTATPCANGARHILESTRLDGDSKDLYEAVGAVVTPIAEVNSEYDDVSPFISEDCLTLYFASDRDFTYDLYVTRRPSVDEPFGPVERIEELSHDNGPDFSGDQADPWVSADGKHIVFTNGTHDADLVEAFR